MGWPKCNATEEYEQSRSILKSLAMGTQSNVSDSRRKAVIP